MKNFLKYSLIVLLSLVGICILFQFQFDASNEADKVFNELLIETILLFGGILLVLWLTYVKVSPYKNVSLFLLLVGLGSCCHKPTNTCPCIITQIIEKNDNHYFIRAVSIYNKDYGGGFYTKYKHQIGDTIK